MMLFGKDSKGKLRQWVCVAEGAEVLVTHGALGGKQTTKRYTAEPKNVGKANETTAEQQAQLEAEAKITKQLKSGYFYTQEEALAFVEFTPMKAQNHNKHAAKIVYPVYMQPKLDGFRLMIDKNGQAWSKQGEPIELPAHWEGVKEFAISCGGLDGEVYAGLISEGGLSLQAIRSAFLTPDEVNTPKLKYFVYDIPDTGVLDQYERLEKLDSTPNKEIPESIVLHIGEYVTNEYQGDLLHAKWTKMKYEGSIYRNIDGLYEFGKRSYNLIKRKDRQDAEAIVESVRIDKNGDGVLFTTCLNGDQVGKQVEFLMRKDADPMINYRKYENAICLIGKAVMYEYEDLSDDGVPLKPVGTALREVLPNGEARY